MRRTYAESGTMSPQQKTGPAGAANSELAPDPVSVYETERAMPQFNVPLVICVPAPRASNMEAR